MPKAAGWWARREPWERRLAVVLGVLIALPGAALFALGQLLYYGSPKANLWIFPDGCQGLVEVTYGVPGAPPLEMEDGYGVIRVPLSGTVTTSSEMITSPNRRQYWYERNGRRVRGPLPISGYTQQERADLGGPTIKWIAFFGTKEALEAVKRERGEKDDWKPGLFGCKRGASGE
jgi:hypothetical protein